MSKPSQPPVISRRPAPGSLDELTGELADAMAVVAASLPEHARAKWSTVVNFIAVSQRVMAETNPSKLRRATTAVWTQALIPPGTKKPYSPSAQSNVFAMAKQAPHVALHADEMNESVATSSDPQRQVQR